MPATTVASLKTALARERRKNRRLRALIDQLQDNLGLARHDIDVQFQRLAQLQVEVDLLKRKP